MPRCLWGGLGTRHLWGASVTRTQLAAGQQSGSPQDARCAMQHCLSRCGRQDLLGQLWAERQHSRRGFWGVGIPSLAEELLPGWQQQQQPELCLALRFRPRLPCRREPGFDRGWPLALRVPGSLARGVASRGAAQGRPEYLACSVGLFPKQLHEWLQNSRVAKGLLKNNPGPGSPCF